MTIATVEGPPSPGPADFELPAIFNLGDLAVTKPMVLVVLAAAITVVGTYLMARPAAVVPGRLQFAGELAYGFVRDSIARDNIGQQYMKFVPYLFAVFTFVLLNNFYGVIPFFQFPTMSRIGFPAAIALVTWVIYNGVGVRHHGFLGYLKHETVPSGVSGPILGLLVPFEFISNIVVRPLTLALRLFATMFAGHLLLILFSLGAEYLFTDYTPTALGIVAGVFSGFLGIVVSFLDMVIMGLQAYVITLLSAMYIGEALADEH
jgi:F-type H+-transporting ATPase subunit a